MTQLRRQIRRAQHRLWFNRWLHGASWAMAVAGAIFAAVVLVQRLYDSPIPLLFIGVILGSLAVLGSLLWTIVRREDAAYSAAKLDEAAGLRERLSSAQCCQPTDDPFARALIADAEQVSTSVSVRQHLRLT
ncbi:MAG: hypothetical protein JSU86_06850, partial [Phycisphaerales bacterium]